MEEQHKTVKELIIALSDYPHMPYWGTLREAIAQLNIAYETGHHTVLVFDESYKLMGMLSQKDILRGLVPKFAEHYTQGVPIFWDDLLTTGSAQRLEKPIQDFMSKMTVTVDGGDSVLKAAHILLQEKLYLLPVEENGKIVGVVRMGDLFQEITNAVLQL